jgi:hypothetical protein
MRPDHFVDHGRIDTVVMVRQKPQVALHSDFNWLKGASSRTAK